jgi:DNA-binding transcriptional LysR family regulator
MIDLRRLRVLRAVAHYGTITAAAKAMHFTTSAASQQLRQLGRELGVELLEPYGRRVRLTAAARSLLAHADAIESRWEQAEIELRAIGDEPAGPVWLCGIPTAVATLLAPVLPRLRARHPRLRPRIREVEQQQGFDLLFDGAVDIAVIEATIDNPTVADTRFDQRPLLDDTFDLVVPTEHRLAGRAEIDLVEAADDDWIIPTNECTCRQHTLAACGAAGFTPEIAHNALEWNAIAHLIAHGLGVALIPRLAYLPPHLPITRLRLTGGGPSRKLLTYTRAGGGEQPAIAAVLDELAAIAPEAAERGLVTVAS